MMKNLSATTGRYLVLLRKDKPEHGIQRLAALSNMQVLSAQDDEQLGAATLPPQCAVVFHSIGVMLVRCAPEQQPSLRSLVTAEDSPILAVEPERSVRALARVQDDPPRADPAADELTWGVRAVGAALSPYSGEGVRIAILDTGLDLEHPDFEGRDIVSRSFVPGEDVQDRNGHGTHCAGIAAGPFKPGSGPRYGVAGQAELYVGKVLSNEGFGTEGGVLEGINWAIENDCRIVSMSLGSPVEEGEPYSRVFEEVARRALAAGTMLIAAAGNESRRPDYLAPVGHPANCPSIMAVGAVDEQLHVAPFSCAGLNEDGGQVGIAAPGVNVRSAWTRPKLYNTISGTSMATPFVAGVAALYAQADKANRGQALWDVLVQQVRLLDDPKRDVGAGLVHASDKT